MLGPECVFIFNVCLYFVSREEIVLQSLVEVAGKMFAVYTAAFLPYFDSMLMPLLSAMLQVRSSYASIYVYVYLFIYVFIYSCIFIYLYISSCPTSTRCWCRSSRLCSRYVLAMRRYMYMYIYRFMYLYIHVYSYIYIYLPALLRLDPDAAPAPGTL